MNQNTIIALLSLCLTSSSFIIAMEEHLTPEQAAERMKEHETFRQHLQALAGTSNITFTNNNELPAIVSIRPDTENKSQIIYNEKVIAPGKTNNFPIDDSLDSVRITIIFADSVKTDKRKVNPQKNPSYVIGKKEVVLTNK